MNRTHYKKSNSQSDQTCQCGHIGYDHQVTYLGLSLNHIIAFFKNRLYGGKCDCCSCKRFKQQNRDGVKQ